MVLNYQTPPNWVVERAKCRIDPLFEAVCHAVEVDKLSPGLRGVYVF